MAASFGRNAFLAPGYGNGQFHVIVQLVIDFILMALLLALRPFNTKMDNGINIAIAIVRVVSLLFLLAFMAELQVNAVKTTIVDMVLTIIQAILTVVLAVLIIANAIWLIYRMIRNNALDGNISDTGVSTNDNKNESINPFESYADEKSLYISQYDTKSLDMSQNGISASTPDGPIVFGQAVSTDHQFEDDGSANYSHRLWVGPGPNDNTELLTSVDPPLVASFMNRRKYPLSQSLVAHSFTSPTVSLNAEFGPTAIRVVKNNNRALSSILVHAICNTNPSLPKTGIDPLVRIRMMLLWL